MFRIIRNLEKHIFEPLAVILFSLSGTVMFLEAIQRSIFSKSFEWSSEISTYSMVWAILLVLAYAGKRGHHIRMEMLISMLSPGIKKAVSIVVHLLSLSYSLLFLYSSIKMVQHAYKTKQLSQSILQLPVWMLTSVMIFTGILLFFYYLEFLVVDWRRKHHKGEIEPLIKDQSQGGV